LRREIQDDLGIGSSLGNLAIISLKTENFPKAYALYTEALTIRRKLGDTWGIAGAQVMLGSVCSRMSLFSQASVHLLESLELFLKVGDRLGIAETIEAVLILQYQCKDYQNCALLLGMSEITRKRIKAPTPKSQIDEHKRISGHIKETIGNKFYEELFKKGEVMSENSVINWVRTLLDGIPKTSNL